MDGSCCGGEESDPHAVHGIQTESGAFILSGKIIDRTGYEDGFVVKVPNSLPDGQVFLHQEEEFNLDWTLKIGKVNKRIRTIRKNLTKRKKRGLFWSSGEKKHIELLKN